MPWNNKMSEIENKVTWVQHVRSYREAHNNCSYKDALKGAKETWVRTTPVRPKAVKPAKIRLLKLSDMPEPVLPADIKPVEVPQTPLRKVIRVPKEPGAPKRRKTKTVPVNFTDESGTTLIGILDQ